MRKYLLKITCSVLLVTGSIGLLYAWGTFGHQHINHAAVLALPEEMRVFFYNHIDFVTEESTVPDLRKYTLNDKAERPRHYIDIGMEGTPAVDSMPRTMKEARARFDEKQLDKMGILPWHIQEMMEKLTQSFKDKRKTQILFIAADLGHYLGDANMPLHTSINHDGQLTDQKGIHSFFEAQLPEYYGNGYNYKLSTPVYLDDVAKASWDVIRYSNSLADSLLSVDRRLKTTFPKEQLYKLDDKGGILINKFGQKTHSLQYAKAFHDALGGMVESQMRRAAQDVANFWYTAWVNAGKPNLDDLDPKELTQSNRKRYKKEMKLYNKGKLFGFKIENEFE